MEIIFSNNIENRRIPFQTSAFNRDSSSHLCVMSLYGFYEMENIFWNKEFVGDISINFSLTYGEEFIEDFVLVNQSNLISKNSLYFPQIIENQLILKGKKEELKTRNHNIHKYHKFKTINSFFLLFIGVLAFPFFFIDGFLAFKGLTQKSPDFFRTKNTFKSILFHINWRTKLLSGHMYSKRLFKIWVTKCFYRITKLKKVKNNRITFLSERRDDLTGNFEFIHDILENDNQLELVTFLKNKKISNLSLLEMIKYANLISTSEIILLDDFYPNIHNFNLKKDTKLIQLWHAVGAFKTFGFSRLGKIGGTSQKSPNHRSYDYAIVSSNEIKRFYAEGFGLSDEKVIATGIPRTDVFFEEEYKNEILEKVYTKFPRLRNNKIILFAPTFRGMGKDDAYYPMDKFDIGHFMNSLENKEKYTILIKHHPFIKEKTKIPDEFKENVLDLSEKSEINDLLFITDLLITDYSSVIFESSILDIPMLFYSFDLEKYVNDRDFYYDYRAFVPGKIVSNLEELSNSINNNDFDSYKVSNFKNRFFDKFDGKSSQRVVDLIYKIIYNNR